MSLEALLVPDSRTDSVTDGMTEAQVVIIYIFFAMVQTNYRSFFKILRPSCTQKIKFCASTPPILAFISVSCVAVFAASQFNCSLRDSQGDTLYY